LSAVSRMFIRRLFRYNYNLRDEQLLWMFVALVLLHNADLIFCVTSTFFSRGAVGLNMYNLVLDLYKLENGLSADDDVFHV